MGELELNGLTEEDQRDKVAEAIKQKVAELNRLTALGHEHAIKARMTVTHAGTKGEAPTLAVDLWFSRWF